MGFRRYVAPTAREALERIRKELGADAVILSNRRAGPNRVEIIAAAQGQMDALVDDFVPAPMPAPVSMPAARKPARPPANSASAAPAPARRTAPESFQEFIRRQSAEAAPRNDGLTMYQQVAGEMDEPPVPSTAPSIMPSAIVRGTAPRAPLQRTAPPMGQALMPAAPAPGPRVQFAELPETSPPAVFRRRPSRTGGSAEMGLVSPVAAALAMPAPLAFEPAAAVPHAVREVAVAPAPAPAPAPAQVLDQAPAPVVPAAASIVNAAVEQRAVPAAAPIAAPTVAQIAAPAAVLPAPSPAAPLAAQAPVPDSTLLQGAATAAALPDSRLMAELQSLRSTLNDRISRLEDRLAHAELPPPDAVAPHAPAAATSGPDVPVAMDTAGVAPASAAPATAHGADPVAAPASRTAVAPQAPVRRQVMTRLIMSGFSPQLARRVGDAAPATLEPKTTDAWLQQVIGQYVRCPGDVDNPLLNPGAVALVGPTGVGKTTTIAKIAARFVVRHGAAALGLVTLDSYRMGAHEQLRGYGRILGVPVHTAHDVASLRELLSSLQGRRQILIDTCGMSQRDPRLGDMLAMIDQVRFDDRPVKRVLLINAASHAETLDEVARGWRVDSAHGAILTKIDEAARIGGALDALMRFQTPLLGLTNGQRVPEDWHPGNPPLLAHIALKPFGAAFALDSDELQALARTGVLVA